MSSIHEKGVVRQVDTTRVGFQDTGELTIRVGDFTVGNHAHVILSGSDPISEPDLSEFVWQKPGDFGAALREMRGYANDPALSSDRKNIIGAAADRLDGYLKAWRVSILAE